VCYNQPRAIIIERSKYKRALSLKDEEFKLLIGVTKDIAQEMISVLEQAYQEKHRKRGRHSKLTIDEMFTMTMEYWRQYPTMFELGFQYNVSKSVVHDIIKWVEDTLIKSGKYSLPGKKALLEDAEIEIVLVDVTESPVERPKKNSVTGIQEKRKSTP
jgi:predicted DNA-binding protein YlxM (UPF0122 family)